MHIVARPDRTALGCLMVDLNQLAAADYPVRLVVVFVGHAVDPALLLALWLYATIEGSRQRAQTGETM